MKLHNVKKYLGVFSVTEIKADASTNSRNYKHITETYQSVTNVARLRVWAVLGPQIYSLQIFQTPADVPDGRFN
jgi:hypothetical protein